MVIISTILSIVFGCDLLALANGGKCFPCLPFGRPSPSGSPTREDIASTSHTTARPSTSGVEQRSIDGRVWEGTCGRPSMQWKALIAATMKFQEMDQLEHPLHERNISFPERPFPWTGYKRGQRPAAVTVIRVKTDQGATDIGIISADTCARINPNYKKFSRIIRAADDNKVDFGIHKYYLDDRDAQITNEIVACYVLQQYKQILDPLSADYPNPDNFGLAKLQDIVPFTDNFKPACLPAENEEIPVGLPVLISGWDSSGERKIYEYKVVEWAKCQQKYGSYEHQEGREFCIHKYDEESTHKLIVSTGAPVLTEKDGTYTFLGMMSLAIRQPDRSFSLPAVVVSLAHGPYQDWLEKTIRQESALWKGSRRA